jgi:hypothetical protein
MSNTFSFDATMFTSIVERKVLSNVNLVKRTMMPDGTVIDTDRDGNVIQASYASGLQVRINKSYCLVRSIQNQFWYGDNNGRWYLLD